MLKCVELGTRQIQEKCASRVVLLQVLWGIANCMHPAQQLGTRFRRAAKL